MRRTRGVFLVSIVTFVLLAAGVVLNVTAGTDVPRDTATVRATPTDSPKATSSADASHAPDVTAPSTATTLPSAAPTASPQSDRASYCAIADRLTPNREYTDQARTYLDWTYALPGSYAPPDLVPVAMAGFVGEGRAHAVRALVVADLKALREAAGNAGRHLDVLSAYRSYAEQDATFAYWVKVGGYEQALRTSARAGHSEHQLGTTIDFTSAGPTPPWGYADWGATPSGRWLAENAWRYGFVLSYPAGKENVTCYEYEPWHYRWIGRDKAADLRSSGLTLREFLAR